MTVTSAAHAVSPTQCPAWTRLTELHQTAPTSLVDLFAHEPQRAQQWTHSVADLTVDISKHLLTQNIIDALVHLAEERDLRGAIARMFAGEHINNTEDRAVLHTALRAPHDPSRDVDGQSISSDVHDVLASMLAFAEKVRSGELRGATGERFTDVINIGIGGSDLGPAMAYQALRPFTSSEITCHFVSNVDPAEIRHTLCGLNPATTLVIITSKTFTTQETMTNAALARTWLIEGLATASEEAAVIAYHCAAVSTALDKVSAFGIDEERTFGFWDWVGGRYSLTSAVGLSLAIGLGETSFRAMLDGFHRVDEHFRTAELRENVPVLMGLLNVWYVNFCGYSSHAVLPYSHLMSAFPRYLQQLTMESNGKSVTMQGQAVDYATGEIFWGEPGTNGQHAFYQLLHQGTRLVPCDFIAFAQPSYPAEEADLHSHQLLLANCLAQSAALAFGRSAEEVRAAGTPDHLVATKTFSGNRPSTTIVAPQLTPSVLGQLIALYEHITYVQGVIWNINSFDQWGVELGKALAHQVANALSTVDAAQSDSSTDALVEYFRTHRA